MSLLIFKITTNSPILLTFDATHVEFLKYGFCRAGMELEDVFADVDTPDCSSDEDAPEILVSNLLFTFLSSCK